MTRPYHPHPRKRKNIRRLKFGALTAIRHAGRSKRGTLLWQCRCDCGETITVDGNRLRNGSRKTCGIRGHWPVKKPTTPYIRRYCRSEYRAWAAIKGACYNKRHRDYPKVGKIGIVMHEPWRADFEVFLREAGKRPSPRHVLRRIDASGSYVPGNVHWIVAGAG